MVPDIDKAALKEIWTFLLEIWKKLKKKNFSLMRS